MLDREAAVVLTRQNLLLQYLVFFGMPLLATCFFGLYVVARRTKHRSRTALGAAALLIGIPGFLAFAYWLLLVVLLSLRGSYGAPDA